MVDKCNITNCTHFVKSGRFSVYRHKFIWIITVVTILTILLFVAIAYSYRCSHVAIVSFHQKSVKDFNTLLSCANISKDSCFYINEQLKQSIDNYMNSSSGLLELQSTKIQSDYMILSLWAGILMIVFLVFTIYSMFKTDEILRQSREGLKAVEDAEEKAEEVVKSVEAKTKQEINKVSETAKEEKNRIQQDASATIEEVRKEIKEMQIEFDKEVQSKSDEFKEMYEQHMKMMKETSDKNTSLIMQLVETIRDSSIEQKSEAQQ